MARVIGIGGIFFKSKDPKALARWYREHLGFPDMPWPGAVFPWTMPEGRPPGYSVWAPFSEDTSHFAPSDKPFMVNLCVDNLDELLAELRAKGVKVLDERRQEDEHGRFGYAVDPEGTLLELWEPAAKKPST